MDNTHRSLFACAIDANWHMKKTRSTSEVEWNAVKEKTGICMLVKLVWLRLGSKQCVKYIDICFMPE